MTPELDGLLFLEKILPRGRNVKPAMLRHVYRQQVHRDELAENALPLGFGVFTADVKRRDLVVAKLLDTGIRLSHQHIDHIGYAEALTRAIDAGERLLGGDCAI